MKIFYLSGIYPYLDRLSGGAFIVRRLQELAKKDEKLDVYSIIQLDSPLTRIFKRLLHKQIRPFQRSIEKMDFDSFSWNYLYTQPSVFSFLWSRLYPQKLLKKQASLLMKKIDFSSCDLIHVQWCFPDGYIAKIISENFSIPYIITAQGSDIHTLPQIQPRTKKYIVHALEGAYKALFVSQSLLEKGKALGYSGKNAVVIPNGADTKVFDIRPKEAQKKALGLSKKVVGFVGQLIFRKRVDKFPEIFQAIQDEIEDVEFLLVGEGHLRGFMENQSKNHGFKTHFAGSIPPDQVAKYLNAMDVLILPSRGEGWACVMMEGQSCGVPVITSDCEGALEGIGHWDWSIEEGPDFEKRFAQKVVELLRNPPNPQEIRHRVLPYDWKNIVQKEWEVYREALSERKG